MIAPNDSVVQLKELLISVMDMDRLKPEYLYPIRCIRIDDPKHIMDNPDSGMILYYNNMRQLPYLYR